MDETIPEHVFRNIIKRLNDGDFVDTDALQSWVEQAESMSNFLLAVPEYSLIGRDLLRLIDMSQTYLRNRKDARYVF